MSHKHTILVVDDEPGAVTLLEIMLTRGGFAVLKAEDAQSALKTLQTHTPDLILLDVTLPDQSGVEVCRRIREQPALRETPVLILSGHSDGETISNGLNAGANDFLTKPIYHADLVAKIRRNLKPHVEETAEAGD
jgi:DNA-binding response OmpR family regulator